MTAIYLSMGLNPHAKEKRSGKMIGAAPTDTELERAADFSNRIQLVHTACENGVLIVDRVPSTSAGNTGPELIREVDSKYFITWARDNFETNFEPLFETTLNASPKNSSNVKAGKAGIKPKRELLDRIKALAEIELNKGCMCQHNELADYLRNMKIDNGSYAVLEKRQSRKGVQPNIKIFIEAAYNVFDIKELYIKGKPQKPDQERRSKKLCGLHRDMP